MSVKDGEKSVIFEEPYAPNNIPVDFFSIAVELPDGSTSHAPFAGIRPEVITKRLFRAGVKVCIHDYDALKRKLFYGTVVRHEGDDAIVEIDNCDGETVALRTWNYTCAIE